MIHAHIAKSASNIVQSAKNKGTFRIQFFDMDSDTLRRRSYGKRMGNPSAIVESTRLIQMAQSVPA